MAESNSTDPEFQKDREWVVRALAKRRELADLEAAKKLNTEEYESSGNMIECGCCFSEAVFESMVQCNGGHLFCTDCARRSAENEIGLRRVVLKCMDSSGCKEIFSVGEAKRFLPEKLFDAWVRITQEEDIKKADIPDLVACPFCPYAQIMPNPDDKMFVCANPECGKRSCRLCKELDHIPLKCSEVEKNSEMLARKKVEEAMTEALLRECPKCHNRFYKTEGCNKMTCTCGLMMCYICRKVIKDYKHFQERGNQGGCPLYDDTNARNDREVAEAAQKAVQAVQGEAPGLNLKVNIPKIVTENPVNWNNNNAAGLVGGVVAVPGIAAAAAAPMPPVMQRQNHRRRRRARNQWVEMPQQHGLPPQQAIPHAPLVAAPAPPPAALRPQLPVPPPPPPQNFAPIAPINPALAGLVQNNVLLNNNLNGNPLHQFVPYPVQHFNPLNPMIPLQPAPNAVDPAIPAPAPAPLPGPYLARRGRRRGQ